MKQFALLTTVASLLLTFTPAQAASELERLRALVTEQERQIRMLEQENAQLRADSTSRTTRSLQNQSNTQLVSAPAATTSPAQARSTAAGQYTVVAGDNLVRIGRHFGVSAQAIAMANGLESTNSIIHPGQKLKIPEATAEANPTKTSSQPAAPAATTRTHTVQAGETFYSISRQHDISVDRLMAANPSTQPATLRVGQKIQVPQSTAVANPASLPLPEPEASPETQQQPATQASGNRRQVRTMMIEGEMSYGAFAAKHGTTPERLNQLNGLDLDARTVLAKGSELYVPAQP